MNAATLFKKVENANAEYDRQAHLQLERVKEISDQVTERLEIEIKVETGS